MLWNLFSRIPELARDLPSIFSEGEPIFVRRIRERFPMGTPEHALISELKQQGFKLDPAIGDFRSATFSRGFVIRTIWSVRWTSKDEQVQDIFAVYGAVTP